MTQELMRHTNALVSKKQKLEVEIKLVEKRVKNIDRACRKHFRREYLQSIKCCFEGSCDITKIICQSNDGTLRLILSYPKAEVVLYADLTPQLFLMYSKYFGSAQLTYIHAEGRADERIDPDIDKDIIEAMHRIMIGVARHRWTFFEARSRYEYSQAKKNTDESRKTFLSHLLTNGNCVSIFTKDLARRVKC